MKLVSYYIDDFSYRKRAIVSKSDLWTFDGFLTKPLLKLKILQKLLLKKVFFIYLS